MKIPKEQSQVVGRRRTDIQWPQREKQGKAIMYKTLHRKLKINLQEPGLNSDNHRP